MKFLLQTQIGIESIAELEVKAKYKRFCSIDYLAYVPHKNGLLQIDWHTDPEVFDYKSLGTVEDTFLILDYQKDLESQLTLKEILRKINIDNLKNNFSIFFDKLNFASPEKEFRLVVRKKAAHDFRRIDLQKGIEDFFRQHFTHTRISREEGKKEIWCTLVKNRLIISLRLTDKSQRQRLYKTEKYSGSLRPTIANAMLFLSELKRGDVVWDPFCGAGTIGCELIENFNFNGLFLTDISPEAIEITGKHLNNLKNYKRFKAKVRLKELDFFASNLHSSIIVSNLPFGNQFEISEDFIQRFFDKVSQIKGLERVIILFPLKVQSATWQVHRIFKLEVLGREVYLQVLKRWT